MKIVISGASKGIGKSIAESFAANGFDLAICARNESELEKTKQEIEAKYKVKVLAKTCDVSIKEELLAFAKYVQNEWGRIDVLINNAGSFSPSLVHTEEEGFLEKMMDTNLYSAYYLSRAFLPKMMEHKSGHIFNITSVAGIQAYKDGAAYGITKAAMMALNRALREELKTFGVKVTAVVPGATLTSSWDGFDAPPERFIPAADIGKIVWDTYKLSKQTVVEEIIVRPILGDL